MKIPYSQKRLFLISILCTLLFLPAFSVRAAYPICNTQNKQKEKNRRDNTLSTNIQSYKSAPLPINDQNQKEDKGIYGILAFVTGYLGIFPAAIVFGIIGSQKRRKLKGLAIAGLIMGIGTLLIILLIFTIIYFYV